MAGIKQPPLPVYGKGWRSAVAIPAAWPMPIQRASPGAAKKCCSSLARFQQAARGDPCSIGWLGGHWHLNGMKHENRKLFL